MAWGLRDCWREGSVLRWLAGWLIRSPSGRRWENQCTGLFWFFIIKRDESARFVSLKKGGQQQQQQQQDSWNAAQVYIVFHLSLSQSLSMSTNSKHTHTRISGVLLWWPNLAMWRPLAPSNNDAAVDILQLVLFFRVGLYRNFAWVWTLEIWRPSIWLRSIKITRSLPFCKGGRETREYKNWLNEFL